MPYRRAQAFREMKKQFDRIPNVELAERIRLGKIGFFDSRRAKFNWRTSLKTLKIKTEPVPMSDFPPVIDELYTTEGAVSYEFGLDEKNIGSVNFKFSKAYSLAAQSIAMVSQGFEIDKLEEDILDYIRAGKEWQRKWVVVTQVFTSPSFSLLIASGKKSEVKIGTKVPVEASGFNIADPKLNLVVTKAKWMAYRTLAKQNVTPFFKLHKLKGDWNNKKLNLEPYGR